MSVRASAGCWWTGARLVPQQGLHAQQAAQQGVLCKMLCPRLLLLLSSIYCRQHAKQQRLPQTRLLLQEGIQLQKQQDSPMHTYVLCTLIRSVI